MEGRGGQGRGGEEGECGTELQRTPRLQISRPAQTPASINTPTNTYRNIPTNTPINTSINILQSCTGLGQSSRGMGDLGGSAEGACSMALLPYGYSILNYARRYDADFIRITDYLASLLNPPSQSIASKPPVKPNYFPAETVREILCYLDYEGLLTDAQIKLTWKSLASEDDLWDSLLRSQFHLSWEAFVHLRPSVTPGSTLPPSKLLYRQMKRGFRTVILNDSIRLPFR
jgi:hypothetical protein